MARVPLFKPLASDLPVVRLHPCGRDGEPRRIHSRQKHHPSTVALVRDFIERTTLTHAEIMAKTTVDKGTISRWAARHGWTRPPGACRPNPRPPAAHYTRNLIGRALATELRLHCERLVCEIAASDRVDPDAVARALDLLARARAETKIRRGRRRVPPTNPPPPRRKPKRQPGDPPITRRSRRRLHTALRTLEGLRPEDTLDRELKRQLRPPGRRGG